MNFQNVEFLISAASPKDFPQVRLPEIAFAGKSNVGKSSVINRVLQRKNFARVGEKPGKTIHVNYFTIDNKCYFVDLPGYGYAKIAKSDKLRWSSLIEGYLMSGRDITLIFQLIDMRHPPSADDLHMINFMIDNELPFVIIFTKADKLNKTARAARMEGFRKEIEYFDDITTVEFSAVTGEGVEKIRSIIEEVSAE